ncbi:hypothetical protein GCM10023142_30330 [Anaerocolumna aminovalerica]|jgi:energy-coupling factor transporter transmembrane protein EcfT|uniref:Uncharacterized protein n=1 Tax=Anaerocolumna aminovalerica TaxID=1527 RepID=A0A1I5HWL8_9FIRM|nr:hypothetical protein [Anaerocolumna aminovalerica]MBU5333158.1 hypothetical protein [Anaerocolumna aminovalerica]MDU6265639.1 hypothetical protein [Anaerocolumna aminovalerica]SFO52685.1 hypothetical protein SAMN04489757_13611 [Anaerocolumna aminovalerica]
MQRTISAIIFFLVIVSGIIALQIFLSKKQNKWLGLILPFICLIFSILAVSGITTFSTFTVTEQYISENGEVINNVISTADKGEIISIIITAISVFLLYNIPTAILLAIYYGCRENLKRKKELEKMNIQDLE